MKKRILSTLVALVAFVAAVADYYLLFLKKASPAESGQVTTVTTESSTVSETGSDAGGEQTETEEVGTVSPYADGVYTGALISTNRGDFQVQATVAAGQLTDITLLEWPQDNPKSQEISGSALPIYTAEAIEKQSAEVTLISGASEAYAGFTGSLQDALNQAQQ